MTRLQFWRSERHLNQIELAAETGVPRYRIQLFEQGIATPYSDEQDRLAIALGVKPDDLFPVQNDGILISASNRKRPRSG